MAIVITLLVALLVLGVAIFVALAFIGGLIHDFWKRF